MKKLLTILTLAVFVLGCNNQNKSISSNQSSETDSCKITFAVEGMTCGGCEQTIEAKVSVLENVKSVEASHTEKTAVVVFNTINPDTTLIKNTISEAGYKVVDVQLNKN